MGQLKSVTSFIAFVLISGSQLLYGQVQGTQAYVERSEELLSRLRLNHTISGKDEITYDQVEGDPFLYKDFVSGAMVLNNGEKYPLNLRYDIFTGEVQFKVKEGTFRIVNAEDISTILIDTLKFQYLGYLKAGISSSVEKSWFILKTDGKCKLLIKKNLRLQAAELPKPYQEARPAKFIHQSDTYYLKPADGNSVRVTSKKDILNILSDKSSDISKFIDSNKLGAKDVDDLAKIVAYYNSL